jgi:superfamily II DNA or RNA helicase
VDGALWVGRLTDELIADHVDWPTFARGQGYAESDHVTSIVPGDHGRVLLAEVLGHGPVAYTTICSRTSSADAATPTWTGRCSCPMRTDCKHTVAVLLAAREHLLGRSGADSAAPVRDWSTALAPLVAEGPPQRDEVGAPLGLIVDLVDPAMTRYGERPRRRVVLRPTRHTRAGMWSKTTTWPELDATGYHQVTVRTDHRNALAPILRLYRSGARGSYAYGNPEVVLDDLGPAIWPLLRGVRAAGVEIMRPPGTPGGVVIGADYGSVVLDVRVAGDDLAVTPSLLDGSGHTMDLGPRSWFLGEPSHGVVRVVGNDVHLIELAAPVPEAVRTLVLDGRPLRVPAEDIDSFLALYLPALRRNTTVVSGDGSVTFPEKAPPVLHVRVGSPSAHTVQVELGFGYAAGTRLVVVPAAAAGGSTARDRDAESALVESLDELDEVDLRIAPERFGSGHWRAVPRLELTGLDALRFVESTLPALEERPEVVVDVDGELPAYEQVVEAPLVRVGTSERGDGIVTDGSQQDWFDLHISVEVGGEEVPFEPLFQALVRGDEVMVLASGSYFRLDVPELDRLRQLIEEARELIDPRSRGLRLTRFHVGLWEELVALGVVDQQSARWAASASALRDLAGRAAPPLPDGLDATLRPYQHEGYGWLSALWDARLGGILADDMGLGKTLQALAMIQRAHERGELAAGPFLVVAPTSVVGTWASEAARFTPGLRVVPVVETGRRRGQELSEVVAGAQVVVTSYALLRIDDASYRELPWSGLILDEAQFVKNHQSKTYQAARRLGAPFTLAITGTPLENSLMDLWSMLSLAAPGLYPSPERFTRNYRKPIESGERPELLDRLRARVRPLMLRRTKDQVASDLPPKQEQVVHVPLAPQHERIYGRHLQRERQKVLGLLADPNGNRVAILRSLTMLRQLALHPGLVDPAYADVTSAKVEVLVELLGEVAAEGHRALVFSQFTSFLRLVRTRLEAEGIATCYLDGRTRDRERRIDEFRSGTAPAFLISLKAGGFGLTLTEADYVFVLDPWWNPAAEAQAVDRAHRIGQDKHVMVYRLVSAATIEEKVVALQERKRDLFTRVVDGGALRSGTLSAADIAALLGPA